MEIPCPALATVDLDRYIAAQASTYAGALAELERGEKSSHWMWFVFPQIIGLGQSENARRYAITGLPEAHAYLAHLLLGARLDECTDVMLGWAAERSAGAILGEVDAMKFRSSMTLFEAAGGGDRYSRALDAFCGGQRDARTLDVLAMPAPLPG
ncbi:MULTISPECIES: DUF1810 domain-containing protein [Sphingomonadaceae]|uniref:DUF1810 domain-containing protein n=1 Tax=Sphingomonadaceae TaxID=41297 RepID=UPI00115C36EF|nr:MULTISPECIES: DUF1810 domain-containing protein [Sphingomonadaceae]QDK31264.1 DUF1810 domain-containing protein [Sphingomonas sp. IC081]QSR16420.1 calpastatin [Novosphingobium sp. KA1]